jgi:tetratricopeptide (TPR) repeat protein
MRLIRVVLGTLALVALVAGGAAAQSGQIRGEVKDAEGKPFVDVVVVLTNDDMGQKFETKTDKNGRWMQIGMRAGVWRIEYKVKEQKVFEERIRLATGGEDTRYLNFKDELAKRSAQQEEEEKKQAEEASRFNTLKEHFDAGRAALDQGKTMRTELPRALADQKPGATEQIKKLFDTAVTEFQLAQQMAGEKDQNLHLILANLGEAYDAAGRYAESVTAYEEAIVKKPDQTDYYVNLSAAQAKGGKVPEATATCDKLVPLNPANAAMCFRNIGIVLYNANRVGEAVTPLRKATELEPGNPDQWYLLGAAQVSIMEFKKEGDKMVPAVPPGTAEAYQKYLELAPSGKFAADAKAGLDTLQALGVGIPTKVLTRKKKGNSE